MRKTYEDQEAVRQRHRKESAGGNSDSMLKLKYRGFYLSWVYTSLAREYKDCMFLAFNIIISTHNNLIFCKSAFHQMLEYVDCFFLF